MVGYSRFLRLSLAVAISTAAVQLHAVEYHVSKDGNDANTGGVGDPFLTIQKGVDSATVAGDIVTVHAGTYTERNQFLAEAALGVQLTNSGAPGNPIIIQAATGEHVILDQQNQPIIDSIGEPDVIANVAGFVTNNTDDIVIQGFEITNAGPGVLARNQQGSLNSLLATEHPERIAIRNNHIHHIYGGTGNSEVDHPAVVVPDNVGAIRFEGCWDCEASDNVMHDIRIVKGTPKVLLCRNGAVCPGQIGHPNTAGIHSFNMENPRIFNNVIFNTHTGVFHKRAGNNTGVGGEIFNNIIFDTEFGVRYSGLDCDPDHASAKIYQNIFFHAGTARMDVGVFNDSFATTPTGSGLMVVYNNTFNSRHGVQVDSFADTRVFNNIFNSPEAGGRAIRRFDHRPATAVDCNPAGPGPEDPPHDAVITVADFNLVNPLGNTFTLGTPINPPTTPVATDEEFTSLAAWQAGGGATVSLAPGTCALNPTPFNCGVGSIEGDPLFASTPTTGVPVNGQYFTLQAGSPAKVSNGGGGLANVGDLPAGAPVDMGAYPTGTEIIGPRSRPLPVTGFSGL